MLSVECKHGIFLPETLCLGQHYFWLVLTRLQWFVCIYPLRPPTPTPFCAAAKQKKWSEQRGRRFYETIYDACTAVAKQAFTDRILWDPSEDQVGSWDKGVH